MLNLSLSGHDPFRPFPCNGFLQRKLVVGPLFRWPKFPALMWPNARPEKRGSDAGKGQCDGETSSRSLAVRRRRGALGACAAGRPRAAGRRFDECRCIRRPPRGIGTRSGMIFLKRIEHQNDRPYTTPA